MSLNIVDSLLDKLSLVSKDRNIPMGNKFTGSQNFLGTNNYLSQSIPSEFTRVLMDTEYLNNEHNRMNRACSLDSKMNYFHYFESPDRLVRRVSRLLSPKLTQDCISIVPNCIEMFQDQEFYLNRGVKAFCEEIDKLSQLLNHNVKFDKETFQAPASGDIPCKQTANPVPKLDKNNSDQPNLVSSVDITCKQMANTVESSPNKMKTFDSGFKCGKDLQLNLHPHTGNTSHPNFSSNTESTPQPNLHCSTENVSQPNLHSSTENSSQPNLHPCTENASQPSSKNLNRKNMDCVKVVPLVSTRQNSKCKLTNFNNAMNEKLADRKNKEMQKRSKKRRRRQKKKPAVLVKECFTKVDNSLKNGIKAEGSITRTTNSASDILCDITIAENASSVQILLPNSSFVISIESADDDSDWDSNSSDCEWLTDCSEFELSGIFISNLSAPLSSTMAKGVCISHLAVPPSHSEEVEMRQLGAVLRRVNKNWMESMKGLDAKPKVATKVSFAPDDELVDFVLVDLYERKGEWETYATERMRFKRRIDELEKIISPCLSKEHRQKVFERLQDSDL